MSETFHEFVVQRSPALSRTAYLLTGDHQHAEDLLQSALARTYRHWRRIRDGDPEAYVRRVMYHQQVSWWRRRRVAERLDATPVERGGGDHTENTALRLSVVAALRRLTARQRAVVVLRYYEDLTEAQVAEVLGCSVGTVKRHGHDAVRRLRDLVPDLWERTPERSGR
ncbi:SigE family RNA polymerase sigma factor [Micromonospora chersina]|uniref:RNA polymerase sigma-70 factor, sigma-E family n=1 Tax=Micromonospora chersina TaxID=47854 RepID=A0A1C6VWP1_9ACTN|nr:MULTISPECIES: SigE family RNA polymerase sigma factor [Micromonospora]MCP3786008.1 SigE family RNA polymerase sigma factor [Micromonospora sp. A3M-1-15]PSK61905.1 RNA polymerase sigma-E factor [Micromonospora sp. MH33]SCL70524.1 RNA polymerase sigma-70 factor, sigma-E family [Micromonospora chersina]